MPPRGSAGRALPSLGAPRRATPRDGSLRLPVPPASRRHGPLQTHGKAAPTTGNFLANAIASRVGTAHIRDLFETPRGLVREAGDPGSGLDSAAAWAVRPFPRPSLFSAIRHTLLRLAARSSRFGILPSAAWPGGDDPWTAPTAWSAWALATLANHERHPAGRTSALSRRDRRAALHLMADLRRAATPLDLLPERVDARTGLPTSTTPLAWSHALTILALRELWPGRASS